MNLVPWKRKRNGNDKSVPVHYGAMGAFRSEMDRLFDRWFQAVMSGWEDFFEPFGRWAPAIDVSETAEEIKVQAEVPGIDPKKLDIAVGERTLTLAGESARSAEGDGENFYWSERRFGSFRRSIRLPAAVDADKASAEYKGGVLTVRLKKLHSASPKRVPISVAKE